MKTYLKQPSFIVELANVRIPIFKRTDIKNGTEYIGYFFTFTQNGKRKQKRAATLDGAKAEAMKVAKDITCHLPHTQELSLAEFSDYQAAMRILRVVPGVTLASVCQQHVEAFNRLGQHGNIADAVATHLRAAKTAKLPSITAADLVQEFLDAKSKEGVSDRYYNDCKVRLEHFKNAFHCSVASISTADLQQWLDKLNGGSRTIKNHASGIRTVFEFAKKRGFLPRNIETEAAHLTVGKVKEAAPQIYTPGTLQSVLDVSTGLDRLAVALGAFTGMRSAELHRLEWSDIKADHIVVSAEKAKTASRRIVPVLLALRNFLDEVDTGDGRVFHTNNNESHFPRFFLRAFTAAGEQTVQNGLRHSFASYRLAIVKSADQVALEMGNSPRKLFQNYRELVTESDAGKWFAVVPKKSEGDAKRDSKVRPATRRAA